MLAGLIVRALEGATKAELCELPFDTVSQPKVAAIGRGDYLSLAEAAARGFPTAPA